MTSNSDVAALLQRTNELLTVLVKAQIGPALQQELAKDSVRKLYELTGGALPVTEISKRVGIATGVISRTWQRWEGLGLLLKEKGRYRRVLDE